MAQLINSINPTHALILWDREWWPKLVDPMFGMKLIFREKPAILEKIRKLRNLEKYVKQDPSFW